MKIIYADEYPFVGTIQNGPHRGNCVGSSVPKIEFPIHAPLPKLDHYSNTAAAVDALSKVCVERALYEWDGDGWSYVPETSNDAEDMADAL